MIQNPCYDKKTHTDCSKRHQGCSINCTEWQTYVEKRNQAYEEKKKQQEAIQGICEHKQRFRDRALKKRHLYGCKGGDVT